MNIKTVYIFCFAFLLYFLAYPLIHILSQSFLIDGHFTLNIFKNALGNYVVRRSIINSFSLAILVVLSTTAIGFPLAYLFARYSFPGKNIFRPLLFLPLIVSPFVGAIGMMQILSRFGSLNLFLLKAGIISYPVPWLGSGFSGIFILLTLHLYPIMFLNISSSLNNFDISTEEASYNLGAGFLQTMRKITFPLLLPGYFAAASIIFIWALTDLGTPLVFEYRNLISIQIFNNIKDINTNPQGYALVLFVVLITLVLFVLTKKLIEKRAYTTGRTAVNAVHYLKFHFQEVVLYSTAFRIYGRVLQNSLCPPPDKNRHLQQSVFEFSKYVDRHHIRFYHRLYSGKDKTKRQKYT